MRATGMRRTWVYQRLQELGHARQVEQVARVARGRWRALPAIHDPLSEVVRQLRALVARIAAVAAEAGNGVLLPGSVTEEASPRSPPRLLLPAGSSLWSGASSSPDTFRLVLVRLIRRTVDH